MHRRALLPLAALVATAVVLAVICAGRSSGPPGATVTNGNDDLHLDPVSYCWSGRCVDGVLRTDTATPLTAAPGAKLRVRSSGFSGARRVAASARLLDGTIRADSNLPLERDGSSVTLRLPSAPGRYQVNVGFNRDRGSAGYAFVIEVN
jgi:hypothetical protein